MEKQGNYYIKTLPLGPGVHDYKYIVDGVWQYDLGQPHQDDGSGNWNNYIEIGSPKSVESSTKKQQQQQQQQPQKKPQQQQQQQSQKQKGKQQQQPQPESDQPQSDQPEKPLSKKQQKKLLKQQQKQQQKQKQHEPEPEAAEPEHEPEPEAEAAEPEAAEPEEPQPAEDEPGVQADAEPEPEPEFFDADIPPEIEGKPVPDVIVELCVVTSDSDTDLEELEKFVRSIKWPGLSWQGSKVSQFEFGLMKLNIVCKCREDMSLEDLCERLKKNGKLVGGVSIENFTT